MKKEKNFLFLILSLGLLLRFYGISWDQGFHLHPDERMLIMVTEKINFNNLNPKFFAYGSFPLYLLRGTSVLIGAIFAPRWASYGYLVYVGRGLSTFFDLGVVILLFKIGKRIWGKKVGLWSAFFYATCIFPIQASHFFAVDTFLNFFVWLTIWFLLDFYQKPNLKNTLKVGFGLGLSLATKVSALVLLIGLGAALLLDLFLVALKFWCQKRSKWWLKLWLILRKSAKKETFLLILKKIFGWGGVMALAALLTFACFEPYAFLDFAEFKKQILAQQQMIKSAYAFPYTLQYVGTTPYFYYLKNLLLWGMGLSLGGLALSGAFFHLFSLGQRLRKKGDYDQEAQELIIIIFGLAYFLVVGRFAVKFMRYFLPLYPLFILLGAIFLEKVLLIFKGLWGKILLGILLFFHLVWLFAFISIYSRPHSRVQASWWIKENIPRNSVLAVEHWDDHLPLFGGEKYRYLEMPLYEPDSSFQKWETIKENLAKADYLILASNRLYTPLQKLGDCEKFERCYPKSAQYYQDLFSGKLGFIKVAEFTSYPGLKVGNWKWEINDQEADESFTVYDHPRVIIYKKISG